MTSVHLFELVRGLLAVLALAIGIGACVVAAIVLRTLLLGLPPFDAAQPESVGGRHRVEPFQRSSPARASMASAISRSPMMTVVAPSLARCSALGVEMRARDDRKIRTRSARLLDDLSGFEGQRDGDKQQPCLRDIGGRQHGIVGRIAFEEFDARAAQRLERVVAVLDHHERYRSLRKPPGDDAPDAAIADEDGMVRKTCRRERRRGRGLRVGREAPPERIGRLEHERIDQDRQDRGAEDEPAGAFGASGAARCRDPRV